MRTNGERYQVVVHVDSPALEEDGDGGAELDDGPAVATETARRLSCDSSVVRIDESDGSPLDVGRRTRAVPPAIQRALQRRDRGCRFPGCENRRFVDAHHIRHWARGGETKLENLVLLCRRHHRDVHEGGYSIELVDGELRFRNPWGGPVPWLPPPIRSSAQQLLQENRSLHIGPDTCASGTGGEMDLSLTVDAMAASCPSPP